MKTATECYMCDVCRSKCKSIWISKDWYLNAQTRKHCSIVNRLTLCGALSHFICFYTFQILCSLCALIFRNTSSNNLWFIMKWIHVSKVLWNEWMNDWKYLLNTPTQKQDSPWQVRLQILIKVFETSWLGIFLPRK